MRFLVDENLPVELARVLVDRGHDVTYVPDSSLRASPDTELWSVAASEERILVTKDLDFPLNIRPEPPGLVIVRVPPRWNRLQIARLFADRMPDEDQLAGRITVISPAGVRSRTLPSHA